MAHGNDGVIRWATTPEEAREFLLTPEEREEMDRLDADPRTLEEVILDVAEQIIGELAWQNLQNVPSYVEDIRDGR